MSSGAPYSDPYDRRGSHRENYGRGPPPPPRGPYGGGVSGGYHQQHHHQHHHRGPPPPPPRGGGGGYHRGGGGSYGRGGPPPSRPRRRNHPDLITFRSYEEEREWLEDRRRKRQARGASKFDQQPTPEQQQAQQAAAAVAAALPSVTGAVVASSSSSPMPPVTTGGQQTRHARRIYVGNLPPNITEAQVEDTFRSAIQQALVTPDPSNHILNVYINRDRRFCFIEFTTVEMTTACMALDGLQVFGQAVKVKRPNDYNALTAPKVHPSQLPQMDVSRLGIVSSTVPDGPNKIFIGGLHYHLQEPQVMELLSAFGKIKAFHLVKNADGGMNAGTSKGYCFVEYADPSITSLAAQGLNGMDIGGGKSLTARLAGGRAAAPVAPVAAVVPPAAAPSSSNGTDMPPPTHSIVLGYDVEELVDAAMGKKEMPLAPKYMDPVTGQPLTRIVPVVLAAAAAAQASLPAAATATNTPSTTTTTPTRILVLHNMVTDDDLATDGDYQGLVDEVSEECRKYGNLTSIRIPRESPKKLIYLEYAAVEDAENARKELQGRQFGDATVDTTFYSEQDFHNGKLE